MSDIEARTGMSCRRTIALLSQPRLSAACTTNTVWKRRPLSALPNYCGPHVRFAEGNKPSSGATKGTMRGFAKR